MSDDSYDFSSLEAQIMNTTQHSQKQYEIQNEINQDQQDQRRRTLPTAIRRSQDQQQNFKTAKDLLEGDSQTDSQNDKKLTIDPTPAKQTLSIKQMNKDNQQVQNQEKQQGQQSSHPNILKEIKQKLKQHSTFAISQQMHYTLKFEEKKNNLILKNFQTGQKAQEDINLRDDLSTEKDDFFSNNNSKMNNQNGEKQNVLPKRIPKQNVQKLKVQLERYQIYQSTKEIGIVTYLKQSINQLEIAQKNEEEYLNIIKSNQQIKQEVDQVQQKNNFLTQQVNNQNIRINELYSKVSDLSEYKELHEGSEKKNANLQNELKEKQKKIKKQSQLIQEKDEIIEKNSKEIKEKAELVQNQIIQIQEADKKLEELKIEFEQQKEKLESQINQLSLDRNELTKYKDLYEKSQQSLIQIQKEKDDEIQRYKKLNEELQKNLEASKLKQVEIQIENIQKIFNEIKIIYQQGGNGDQQIKEVLQQLNPQTKIQDNQVQFTKAYKVVSQSQPSDSQRKEFQIKNDNIVQKYLQGSQQTNQIKAPQNQANKGDQDSLKCLIVLQNMFKQDGISTFITDVPIQTLEKDQNYKVQQSFLQVGLHNQAQYFSIKIDNQSKLYQNLIQSKTKQNINEFIQKLKQDLGQKVNSQNPQQDITILNADFDKHLQIDFQIKSQQFNSQELKKKITFSDIGLSVSEKSLLEFAKLSVNMFDSQYNNEWPESQKGKYDIRGQLKFFDKINPVDHIYHFPAGYKGYALNIDRYGEDKSWISQKGDEKTWIVLFYGTNENAILGIIKENLTPGYRNLHGGGKCRITNTIIKDGPNANIYLTDDMSVAEHFAKTSSTFEGKKYYIIFQCRVNPNGVKSPQKEPRYYTVEDNINIRPYRILLREVQRIQYQSCIKSDIKQNYIMLHFI
ncbi:hypothetical protein ABPG72_009544 [Tetrahymena utriculariae]